jgi:hypothetical protein
MSMPVGALIWFNHYTGKNPLGGMEELGPRGIRTLIWSLLLRDDNSLTEEEVGALITPASLPVLFTKISQLRMLSMPSVDPAEQQDEGTGEIDWLLLWALGRYDLGLSDSELWEIDLRQFYALLQRKRDEKYWQDWRAALVTHMIANVFRDTKRKSRPFKIEDFMPETKPRKQEERQQLAIVETMVENLGGKIYKG